jgi:hypothetical protein
MNEPTDLPVKTPRAWLRHAEGDLGVVLRELVTQFPAAGEEDS